MSDDDDKTVFVRSPRSAVETETAKPSAKALKSKLVCIDDSMLAPSQKGFVAVLAEGEEQILGRDKENSIFLDSNRVSRKHAAIYPVDGGWGIRDLNSTNGVFVNEKRITDTRLKPGDWVKLGTIPFRFELERPDVKGKASALDRFKEMGEDDSEKTMMFGDVRASTKLLAAQESKDAAEPAPPPKKKAAPPPVARPVRRLENEDPTIRNALSKPRASLPIFKTVLFTFVGAIVLAGLYFGYGMLKESNIVETKRDDVNRFVRSAATGEDPKRFGDERKALAKLKDDLFAAIASAPDKPELGQLLGRVIMLEFERNFYDALTPNDFAKARDVINATRKELSAAARKLTGGGAGGQSEADNLLDAMEPTVALREFAKAFPDPQQKSPVPTSVQLDDLLRQKTEFTKLQKAVNMDLVRYPYLGHMLDQGNLDIRLVERWGAALRAAASK